MIQSLEYVFSDEMLKLLDHFTSFTHVRISFFSLNGKEQYIGKNRDGCGYCTMRRQSHTFDEACRADDRHGREMSLEKDEVHLYRCHAGLFEAVMPVRMASRPIGYVMIGQIRLAGFPVEAESRSELYELSKIPEFSREKLDDLLSLFKVLIQHITSQALVGRRDDNTLAPLVDRMRKHPEEPLTLVEAARFVRLSPSRLSHVFTSMMGINFKRYQITQRLDLADRLLKANPGWRMARVAEGCGFEDQFYFSRVYKDYRGYPPSKAVLR